MLFHSHAIDEAAAAPRRQQHSSSAAAVVLVPPLLMYAAVCSTMHTTILDIGCPSKRWTSSNSVQCTPSHGGKVHLIIIWRKISHMFPPCLAQSPPTLGLKFLGFAYFIVPDLHYVIWTSFHGVHYGPPFVVGGSGNSNKRKGSNNSITCLVWGWLSCHPAFNSVY